MTSAVPQPRPVGEHGLEAWCLGFDRLSPDILPTAGFRRGAWPGIYAVCERFLSEFGEQAAALGWTAAELFGVHPSVGLNRIDCCGALILSHGSHVVAISNSAIRYANGLTFYRKPRAGLSVPVWEFRA